MPIAPVPLFGVAQKLSGGQAVSTILLAMIAMVLTAFSYGRMAALYPSAGSAYTYVTRGLNPHLGFLAGWAMFLDYLLVPLICTVYGALTIHRLVPEIPYAIWAALLAAIVTAVNLRGIRATATANLVLMIVMCVVTLGFMALALRWLFGNQGWHGVISTSPFYNPSSFNWRTLATGTSLAALTYGGFDGVTTLSEEVENPRRNVLLATVLVCVFTGIFGGAQIYLAQRVWPDYTTFRDLDTAFLDVSRVVGGALLFHAMAAILILANFGSALAAQAGVARLLFGMGRDGVIPRRWFAYLSPRRNTPAYNVIGVGLFAFAGALFLDYERAAELINFGAFLAFMGVNAAVVKQFGLSRIQGQRRVVADILVPGCGFVFCLIIWVSLPTPARIIGSVWFGAGLLYDAVRTKGFRSTPSAIDFSEV
jgi:putrescine importer